MQGEHGPLYKALAAYGRQTREDALAGRLGWVPGMQGPAESMIEQSHAYYLALGIRKPLKSSTRNDLREDVDRLLRGH